MIIKKRIIKEKVVESKLGKSSYKEQNYQYDEYGNIKSYYNEFNTLIKEDSYNKQGLLLKEKYYDVNEKEYSYQDGRLAKIFTTNPNYSSSFTYLDNQLFL